MIVKSKFRGQKNIIDNFHMNHIPSANFSMERYVAVILLALFVSVFQWKASLCVSLACLLIFHWRKLYIILKTLPRDLRLFYRGYQLMRKTVSSKKMNISVVDAFNKQLKLKPRKPCFYFEDQIWTYEDVEDFSNELANVLSRAGFGKGDVAALMMNNCPEHVCTWLGLAKIGVVTALINTNISLRVLAHCINSSNAKAIIFSENFTSVILEAKDMLEREDTTLYMIGGSTADDRVQDLSKLMTSSSRKPPQTQHKPGYDDQLLYIYTSGTTGKPKAARFPHSRYLLLSNAAKCLFNLLDDDIIYNALPLYHVAGGGLGVGPALIHGIPAVLKTKFSASGYFEDCVKYNCTVGLYIGEMCRYLLTSRSRPADRQHQVRMFVGSGLHSSVWRRLVERFGVSKICEIYGATEGNVNTGNIDGKVGAIGCIPQCLPKCLVPVAIIRVDEATHQPVRDSKGLCIRCEQGEIGMFVGAIKQNDPTRQYHGYLNKEESQSKIIYNVFKHGDQAFVSGDLVRTDEEGYVYFRDRTGDTFRWKGENVSTSEVEDVARPFLGERDCIVYGVHVGELEGRAGMIAVSECEESIDLPGLAEGLDRALPSYARPLFLRIARDLPLTGTFKVKKADLQKEGFDPAVITDKLYFRQAGSFTQLTLRLYQDILSGVVRV